MSHKAIGLRLRPAAAALLAAVCLFPFVYLFGLSLVSEWSFPAVWPSALSLNLWRRVLGGSSALGSSFLLSLGVSSVVAGLSTVAGFITGKFIAYHPRRSSLLFLAYVPFVMSPVVLGTCLMFLYIKAGLTGNVAGVMVAQTMFAYGFSIVFFSAFWNAEVRALEDLVYTLGGSTLQAYRRVLIPVSRGALLICFFQTFLISWFQYGLTILIGSGKVQTLPVKVYEYIGEANVYYAAIASCLLVLPPALLLWANKRFVFKQV
ncbi:MAG: hypothetical protein SH809_19385 [Rhodothermales bacterium]|nr:hypothetical protein [Rhodothermales bacterium]